LTTKEEEALQYIELNPDCTKTKVIDYMDGKLPQKPKITCSPVPTTNIIKRFILEKKIFCREDNINSQKHLLRINDKHSFNIIHRRIKQTEKFIGEVISELDKPGYQDSDNLKKTLSMMMPTVFLLLSLRISKATISDKEKEILYSRIIRLTDKCSRHFEISYLSNLGGHLTDKQITSTAIIHNINHHRLKFGLESMRDTMISELNSKEQ